MRQVDSRYGEPPIRSLALALDGSEPSGQGVRMATQLARRLDAEVLVMCALEWHPRYGGVENAETVRRDVRALVQRLRAVGVPARGEVIVTLVGEGARMLARKAVDSDAGLILVSVRGPRLLRWLGISFGRRLARASRVPVLMLPAERLPAARGAGRDRPARIQVLQGG